MLTSLFSLFYVTVECCSFLHRRWSDRKMHNFLLWMFIYPGHSGSPLIRSFLSPVLLVLDAFFQIWYLEISRETQISRIASRSNKLELEAWSTLPSWFWRNVRRFSRAFNVKYRDQISLTVFFEAFPKGWWWKMSGGNRNSYWKFTAFCVKRKRDCHLSLRLRLSWSWGVFSWTGSLSSLRRLKVHMECFI